MPKDTFFHLKQEKKDRIINAAKKEFSTHLLHKSRVSNIIEDAKIPRGSFYQYFDDLEDLFYYIIDLSFEDLFKEGLKIASETNDLFEFLERTFVIDYKGYFVTKNHLVLMNLMQNANFSKYHLDNHMENQKKYISDVLSALDFSKYRPMTESEKIKLYELLQSTKRHVIHVCRHKNLSLNEALIELKWQLDIFERGITI